MASSFPPPSDTKNEALTLRRIPQDQRLRHAERRTADVFVGRSAHVFVGTAASRRRVGGLRDAAELGKWESVARERAREDAGGPADEDVGGPYGAPQARPPHARGDGNGQPSHTDAISSTYGITSNPRTYISWMCSISASFSGACSEAARIPRVGFRRRYWGGR